MIDIAGAQERLKPERRGDDRDRPLELFGPMSAGVKRECEQVDVAFDGIEDLGRSDIMLGPVAGTECQ